MISSDLVIETGIGLIVLTLILIGIFISCIKEDDTVVKEKNKEDIENRKKKYIKNFCTNIFNVEDRISRKDFFITWLLIQIIIIILIVIAIFTVIGVFLLPVLSIFIFIGLITMAIRRLNDINKSKWYLILLFIPLLVNIIFFIYLCCAKSVDNNN